MRTFLRRVSFLVALLAAASCTRSAPVHEDAGSNDASLDGAADATTNGEVDASFDGAVDATKDASEDGTTVDASADDGGTDACLPPPCAAPPPGCQYEAGTPCTCGTLVCDCPTTAPASCCYADADCAGPVAAEHCAGEQCGPGGASAGVCVAAAPKGGCWEDADCAPGEVCADVALCPCGVACLIADHPGTCAASAPF